MSIQLKLTKGLSYRGGLNGALKATKDKPFISVETKKEAEAAVATGYFEIVGAAAPAAPAANLLNDVKSSSAVTTADLPKALSKMTTDELVAKATDLNVDISECKTNKERVETIQAAIDAAAEAAVATSQQDENAENQETTDDQQDDGDSSQIPFQEE
ncbi:MULTISPECIES: hypothetical protein [unclassified Dehalobacter]|uniref:hypothetical protein n=1 Tax=unclassified Dehalobacter TaxID=2635733 RepID=UPI00104998B6|nr:MULTISPECIES: hypothetical protein [unclassified Dehalobacter]TCX51934.1 hypothetical protein C1I36_06350 [Dehalobacter sp. 14DCB1]TCX52994.1 hypothetical protein C1I38_08030 [Dehalobacter sp. 12DCB1]